MYVCYIDESGDTGILPSATSPVQPALVIGGLILRQADVAAVTRDFVHLKALYFPRLGPPKHQPLNWILREIKGSDVRANAASKSRRERRHALGFLEQVVRLIEAYRGRIIARVWIKAIASPIYSTSIYTSSVQYIHTWFEDFLATNEAMGWVIADSRTKPLNAAVSHSIFTGKYRKAGDKYPHVAELLTFGHSENHAGVQLADLVCSALLFPMAVDAYCSPYISSLHVRPRYRNLRDRFGARLRACEHTGRDRASVPPRLRGGITVDDPLGKQPKSLLFRVPPAVPTLVIPSTSGISVTASTVSQP